MQVHSIDEDFIRPAALPAVRPKCHVGNNTSSLQLLPVPHSPGEAITIRVPSIGLL